MKVEYTYSFHLPRNIVWKYIQDAQVLRSALPGCQSFEERSDGVYLAEMGVNVGPIKGLFTTEVQQTNQIPPSSYRLMVKGKGKPGEIDAIADMFIKEVKDSSQVTCVADVEVTGVLASVGQRVMGGVAKIILSQFFKAAEKEMKKEINKV
ncbi:CoxG family protein [Neobacillus kokaensis]|uniref:Carbon monoxide dehydrogenase n=1 Tax=Neobacillus kokaensis TaxID=2759023 RepID=A0ABQ3N5Q2_9BACI|nr:carbon monoxide dehydrogenase subunit G [Neobacillus kokaensis]GHH99328.1 carbon monoxide dehydrogenase [Neobacillus kokaensis]